jgi:hypothetical protein
MNITIIDRIIISSTEGDSSGGEWDVSFESNHVIIAEYDEQLKHFSGNRHFPG